MPKAPTPPPEFGGTEPTKGPGGLPSPSPSREEFESYMEKTEAPEVKETGISPMELQAKRTEIEPTPENLLAQVDDTKNKITEAKTQLQTPNLQLKNSHQRLIDNKLSQSLVHIDKASDHLGANKAPSKEIAENMGPVAKFLTYLGNGQDQLVEAKKKLEDIQATKEGMTPTQMLLVQVNLSQAQQQIGFASVLLSKVADALKQAINIQL